MGLLPYLGKRLFFIRTASGSDVNEKERPQFGDITDFQRQRRETWIPVLLLVCRSKSLHSREKCTERAERGRTPPMKRNPAALSFVH